MLLHSSFALHASLLHREFLYTVSSTLILCPPPALPLILLLLLLLPIPVPPASPSSVEVDPAEIDPDAHLLQQRLRIHHLHHTLQHAHAGLPALATALRRRPIKPRAVALQFTVIDLFRCPWDVTSTFAPEGGNDCAVHPLALDENHNSNSSSGRADADGTEGLDGSAKRPKRSPKTTATGSADCHASVRVQRMSPLDSSDSGLVPADDADTLAASSVIVVSLIGAPDSVWAGPEHGQWLRLAFKLQPLLDVVPVSVPVLVLYDSYGVSAAHVTTRLFAHLPFVHVQAVGLSAAELALACQTQGRTAEEAGQVRVVLAMCPGEGGQVKEKGVSVQGF